MDIKFEIVRSNRRTVSLEITKDAKVLVRAPQRMRYDDIEEFVLKHRAWIDAHLCRAKERELASEREDEAALRKKAAKIIPERVKYYSSVMGLVPTGVRITGARTRFGSCSPKNSLSFSCYLAGYPDEAIDYVVVHELAHIREKNHGKNFYAIIESVLPDYKERIALLKK